MRRLLVPVITACLLLVATSAQARYGAPHDGPDRADGVVDTWLVSGDHVVGRSQIGVSPVPKLSASMVPGHTRVFAWRVSNVAHAPEMRMGASCQGDDGIDFHFFTPKGERVTGQVTHWGFRQGHVDPGTFRTLYVYAHVHLGQGDSHASCAMLVSGYHSHDRVRLRVIT